MIFQFQRTGVNLLTLSPVLFLEPPEAQVTRECVAPTPQNCHLVCKDSSPILWSPAAWVWQKTLLEIFTYGFFFFRRASSGRTKIKAWEDCKVSTCAEDQNPLLFPRLHLPLERSFSSDGSGAFSFRKHLKMSLLAVGNRSCWGTGLVETGSFRDVDQVKSSL